MHDRKRSTPQRTGYLLAAAALAIPAAAFAQNLNIIGDTQLLAFDPTLNGAGVTIGQAEADVNPPADSFEVNPSAVGQPASLFTYTDDDGNVTNAFNPSYESGHADDVAGIFYGNGGGVAPGVAHVDMESADWFASDIVPDLTPIADAVVNQSFIFTEEDNSPLTAADQATEDSIYDNYIAEFGTIMVSAAGNSGAYPDVNAPATCYNGIGVGADPGPSSTGPTIDNGRSKPDITAPGNYTSFTTPLVAGSATVLVEAGGRGDGGDSSAIEAEAVDARTVKALLLNGASKTAVTFNRTTTAPLDPINGAGLVNVFNSYLELIAGQHSASLVEDTAAVGAAHDPLTDGQAAALSSLDGWDFSTLTTSASNDQYANYLFAPPAGYSYTFTATLVWERQFNSNPNTNIGINNLDLYFYDITTGQMIDSSVSTVDNVQDVYDVNLPGGDEYDLEVLKNGGTAGTTNGVISDSETYALAYNFASPTNVCVWDTAGGGSWGTGSDWALSIAPQNAGDTAMFAGAATGASVVTLDGDRYIGVLVFNSSNSYTLTAGSGGILTMNSPTEMATISDTLGSHTISAPVNLNVDTTVSISSTASAMQISGNISGSGSLTQTGAGTLMLSGVNSYSGGTNVNGGNLIVAAATGLPNQSAISIGTAATTGQVQLAAGKSSFTLSGLNVSTGSTLDAGSSTVILTYSAGNDPIQQIAAYLQSGFAGGAWNGTGITSSAVVGLNGSSNLRYAVGYADGADGVVSGLSSGQIEILPTLAGDGQLAGTVSFYDFQLVLSDFGKLNQSWDEGDFDYSGTVDFYDFQVVLANFGQSDIAITSTELSALDDFAGRFGERVLPNANGGLSLVAVPEPACAGVLMVGMCGILARRRGRRGGANGDTILSYIA